MTCQNKFSHVINNAEQVVYNHEIKTFPVDPFEIAKSNDIEVIAKPNLEEGVSGMLIRHGNEFAITYATHIQNTPFQRFCVAHELGHYFLPSHFENIFTQGYIHQSQAGFKTTNIFELEADHFAAGLLMPRKLFIPEVYSAGEGIEAIKHLSSICETSLISTAIRLTQCANYEIAIIVSSDFFVEYCFMSDSLKEFPNIDWIYKGTKIPINSATYDFNKLPNNIEKSMQKKDVSRLSDWFEGARDIEICEDVIGLGSYGKTLTILHGINISEEDYNDEEIRESWN